MTRDMSLYQIFAGLFLQISHSDVFVGLSAERDPQRSYIDVWHDASQYTLHMHKVTCCSVLQCVAVCCNVLQCVAVCCSVLQCVAAFAMHKVTCHQHCKRCNTLQHTATHSNTLAPAPTAALAPPLKHCNTLQHTLKHCNTLQHTATHGNTLQHTCTSSHSCTSAPRANTATTYNTLQHTATHCNTLQHTATHLYQLPQLH